MDIYVQSCGISKGYCWLDQNQTRISDLPDNFKGMLKIVDGDYFSLAIYRANGQLSLLVTALESQNRIDNRTRKICNSLLWAGKDSDEATLRSLSIQALNGELAAKVDPAVVSENNAQGFTLNFDLLKPENFGLVSVENNPTDSSKIGNLSALKDELIDDLKKYALPKHDGMLVVVCSTVSQSSLEREQVWRGLSDQISDDEWIALKEDKNDNFRSDNSNKVGKSASDSQQSSPRSQITPPSTIVPNDNRSSGKTQKWLSLILAFILGLLLGIIANQVWYHFTDNQLKQNIESLKSEIIKLEKKNKDLVKDIDLKQSEIKVYEQF